MESIPQLKDDENVKHQIMIIILSILILIFVTEIVPQLLAMSARTAFQALTSRLLLIRFVLIIIIITDQVFFVIIITIIIINTSIIIIMTSSLYCHHGDVRK